MDFAYGEAAWWRRNRLQGGGVIDFAYIPSRPSPSGPDGRPSPTAAGWKAVPAAPRALPGGGRCAPPALQGLRPPGRPSASGHPHQAAQREAGSFLAQGSPQ